MNEPRKLYSKAAIMLATFLGGPLGGSIVMRRNSVNLGRNSEGSIYGARLDSQTFDDAAYQKLIDQHISNDEKALKIENVYTPHEERVGFIEQTTIPTLKKNLEICENLLSLRELPEDKRERVLLLKQYTELQIEKYHMVLRTLSTDEDLSEEIHNVIERIKTVLEELYEKDSSLFSIV